MALTQSILVLRALGLGDLLTSVPALRGLKNAYPDERVVLAAPEALRALVDLIDAVDELLPTAGLGALQWQEAPPRLAVNLHGRGPESIRDLLAVRPETLLTHHHPAYPEVPGLDWRDEMHEVDRWCRLLEYGRIDADRTALLLPAPPQSAPESNVVVLHPGAAYPARRWPSERFARVARELSANGHRVVITGARGEMPLANAVAERAGLPPSAVYAGRTDLTELAALVAEAALVVCGDTGVGHLATAFGTSSILLFGPTPPHRWGPPAAAKHHVTLWAGQVGDPHSAYPDPGLLLLHPEHVLRVATGLLAEKVRHG
ncbi:glycosyltransferase family 9 protein [Nocardia amamiensis]|uniref:Glycosyltransferase family 9 protein n=1 Tax=Nocardia amamiensis TaxID=404578 RepID=A0ABS0CSF9_9NOCA|nr:glycosyltransferase family 9 protein [Nocardia amamiensis]MBF6299460.1 glycosyltransferase family 9 protein [Nocardia amamiensis]